MKRSTVNKAKDARIFSATANKSKTINISPMNMRGGIRL